MAITSESPKLGVCGPRHLYSKHKSGCQHGDDAKL